MTWQIYVARLHHFIPAGKFWQICPHAILTTGHGCGPPELLAVILLCTLLLAGARLAWINGLKGQVNNFFQRVLVMAAALLFSLWKNGYKAWVHQIEAGWPGSGRGWLFVHLFIGSARQMTQDCCVWSWLGEDLSGPVVKCVAFDRCQHILIRRFGHDYEKL